MSSSPSAISNTAPGAGMGTPVEGVTPATRRSLKHRVLESGAWTVGGDAVGRLIKFGSNIALAWLVLPEAVGLMALVNTFMMGLEMFSDVGIGPAIIHSKRGDDPRYLNTAWTIQVLRGLTLWAVAIAIAYPVAQVWNPYLLWLLPVAGMQSAIAGFTSTGFQTANRKLNMRRIVMLGFARQISGVAVMLTWAYFSPTVWALIAGNLAGHVVRMVGSYLLLPGVPPRFVWDRDAAHELFRFGRWIFLSTVLTFLAGQSDKLLFEPLLGAQLLGMYWFASQFVQQVPAVSRRLNDVVGFPALAELHRKDHDRFLMRMRQIRLVIVGVTTALLILAGLIGPPVMEMLYPRQYHGVGWMIAILVIGTLAGTVNTSYGSAWMAVGKTQHVMLTVAAQFALVLLCALGGYTLHGQSGFILGLSAVPWLLYPFTAVLAYRSGVWQPKLDLAALAVSAVVSAGLLALHGWEMPT